MLDKGLALAVKDDPTELCKCVKLVSQSILSVHIGEMVRKAAELSISTTAHTVDWSFGATTPPNH